MMEGYPRPSFSSGLLAMHEKSAVQPQDQTQVQAVVYDPLYTTATFDSKAVDTGLPVGKTAGTQQVSLTGAATYAIPFVLPPGLQGMTPSLGIAYSSQAGNGLLGTGWTLTGLSAVQRTGQDWYHDGRTRPVSVAGAPNSGTPTGPFALDGQRLVAVNGVYGANGTEYRTEQATFARVYSLGVAGNGPAYFQVETKQGLQHQYGGPPGARLNEENGNTALYWAINRSYDQHGNYIEYRYQTVNRELLLDEVRYYANSSNNFGPLIKVSFVYEDRFDPNTAYLDGSVLRQNKLLTRVTVSARDQAGAAWQTEREYAFSYGKTDLYSQLIRVREYGNDGFHLNETIFQYGDASPNVQTSVTTADYLEPSHNNFTGDFDGDGFTDLIKAEFTMANGVKYYRWLDFYRKDPTGNEFTFHDRRLLPVNYTLIDDINVPDQTRFQTSDFDGDGRAELLLQRFTLNPSGGATYTELDEITIFGLDQNLDFQIEHSHPIAGAYRIGFKHQALIGDFDGDQRTDYLTTLSDGVMHKSFFSSPSLGVVDELVGPEINSPSTSSKVFSADQAHVLDYDGDGKAEVMLVEDFYTRIYTFERNPLTNLLESVLIYQSGYPTKWHHIRIGDFNGDGKSDLFTENGSGLTEIAYSTGEGNDFQTQVISMAVTPDLSAVPSGTPRNLVQVLDLNGDGKTELVHMEGPWAPASSSRFQPVTAHLYYTNGLSFFHQSFGIADPVHHDWPFFPGDYNGDGGIELFFNRLSGADRIYRFRPQDQSRLLKRVSDGFDLVTEFSYRYLTEGGSFYTTGTGASYPLNDVRLPLPLVSQMTVPDGIGGTRATTFQYAGAKLHRQGRGWLGFQSMTTTDALLDIRSTQEMSIEPGFFVALPSQSLTRRHSNGQLLTSQTHSYRFVEPGTANTQAPPGAARYVLQHEEQQATDHLTGAVTTERWEHDAHGNVEVHQTDLNGIELHEQKVLSFSSNGSWMPYLPTDVLSTSQRSGQASTSVHTCFSYHADGNLATQTDFCGTAEYVETSYPVYNSFGQPMQQERSSPGLPTQWQEYEYDSQQRLRAVDSAAGQRRMQYNVWGALHSERAVNGNLTTYQYDGFGRLTSQTDPLGNTTTQHTQFTPSPGPPPDGLFETRISQPGEAEQETLYDAFGRERMSRREMFQNGEWSTVVSTYDAKGNLATQTLPYQSGPGGGIAQVTQTYTYDFLNRVIDFYHGSAAAGHTTYQYTDGPNGQRAVSVTTPDGLIQTEVTDATGKAISRTDPGGTLTMQYNSRGQTTAIYLDGTLMSSMGYDPTYGRQTSLTDANAGTTTYAYNAYGQLTTQTDAKGQTIEMSYDVLGRITSKATPEGTTGYLYHGASKLNQIGSILYGSNAPNTGFPNQQDFAYDTYGRLTEEHTQIDGNTYSKVFGYDAYGRLQSTDYASGFGVRREYNARGYLASVTDHTGAVSLFAGQAANANGQYTQYTRGNNGLTTARTYDDFGRPLTTAMPGQYLANTFDPASGNLTARTGVSPGGATLTESFTYDPLNRLRDYSVSGQGTMSVAYQSNGNIQQKTDAGLYQYNAPPPHAVTDVSDPQQIIPIPPQHIAYNSQHNPTEITEDGYQLTFTYGAEQTQRIKTVLTEPSGAVTTRYYFGAHERQLSSSGSTQDIHYVAGGDGLCAIVVRENGQDSYYYTHTDHLGSILTLCDDAGNILFAQNFDPWGRARNPLDWRYTPNPFPQPDWLYRGYTGHEMLPEFGLIHMNGRMYDPLLGRMLSPDNYVHGWLGSQGYNRYSYVGNNPLRYVDPSGEELVTASIIVGALIFGYLGGVATNQGIYNPVRWDWGSWKTYAGVGAGMIIGGAAGLGFATLGPWMASSTPLFQQFGFSYTATAFGLAGAAAGGVGGYLTGVAGGLIMSNGNWSAAHQNGLYYAQLGAGIGSGIGTLYGLTADGTAFLNNPPPINERAPIRDNYGNSNGECAYRCFEEFSESYGLSEYDYDYWSDGGRLSGLQPGRIDDHVNNSGVFGAHPITHGNIGREMALGRRVMMGFGTQSGGGHAVMVNRVVAWDNDHYMLWFSETSPTDVVPVRMSRNLIKDFGLGGVAFWSFYPKIINVNTSSSWWWSTSW